jgi:hypothetical protein
MNKPIAIITTVEQQEEVYVALKSMGKASNWESMMRGLSALTEEQIQFIKDKYK